MLGRYSVYAVNVLSMMVLARIFSPEIFGVIASITVFSIFFQMLSEAGLGPAVINLESLDKINRNGIFGLTVCVGVVVGLLFYVCSPVFFLIYKTDESLRVIPYVAASLVCYSSAILPMAFLLREQSFGRIAVIGAASEVISTISTVALLQITEPIHALASKSFISAATNFSLSYYFSGNSQFGRPALGWRFAAIKPLLSFSANQFGFNLANFFTRNLDNILVARYLGAAHLGVYDKAYQIMRYPLLLLTFAMTPAIQPVIRRHAGDIDAVEKIHRDLALKLSVSGALVGLFVFAFASNIVSILLGENWREVIPVVRVLALAIPVQVVLSSSGSFFQALNRVDIMLKCGIFSSVVTLVLIVCGIMMGGLIGLSWAIVLAFHINFIQAYYLLYSRVFGRKYGIFLRQMLPVGFIISSMVVWQLGGR